MLYGATGSFQIIEIQSNLAIGIWQSPMAIIGSLFLLAGFTFKIGAVPFHFWGPDVYDGASNAVLMYMSTVVKIAGIYAIINVFGQVFRDSYAFWIDLICIIIVLSMFYGYITAWKQTSFRRLIAYSSIANAGLMLFALADIHNSNIFLFVTAYALSTIAMVVVNAAVNDQTDSLANWEGIAWRNPLVGVALVLALFSLAGIPPLAGFFGKFMLINSAVSVGLVGLAIVMVVLSCISLFYYLSILVEIWLKPATRSSVNPQDNEDARDVRVLVGIVAAASLVIGVVGPRWVASINTTFARELRSSSGEVKTGQAAPGVNAPVQQDM